MKGTMHSHRETVPLHFYIAELSVHETPTGTYTPLCVERHQSTVGALSYRILLCRGRQITNNK